MFLMEMNLLFPQATDEGRLATHTSDPSCPCMNSCGHPVLPKRGWDRSQQKAGKSGKENQDLYA